MELRPDLVRMASGRPGEAVPEHDSASRQGNSPREPPYSGMLPKQLVIPSAVRESPTATLKTVSRGTGRAGSGREGVLRGPQARTTRLYGAQPGCVESSHQTDVFVDNAPQKGGRACRQVTSAKYGVKRKDRLSI